MSVNAKEIGREIERLSISVREGGSGRLREFERERVFV